MPIRRSLSYRAHITRDFAPLLFLNVLGACALVLLGMSYSQVLQPVYGIPFVVLGGVVLVLMGLHVFLSLSQTLVINSSGVEMEGRIGRTTIPWQEMAEFDAVPRGLFSGRRAVVGNNLRTIMVDSSFFQDFDHIVSLILIGRRRHRETWLLVNRVDAPPSPLPVETAR
ncbi:MAG: hypothetical protein FJX76_18490 [Armatimonadetes bacterium]|nr:hypothetical protein [Armatimonadota bacterium]